MDLLKRNAFLIFCLAVGGGGIGLMFTGAQAMPEVAKEMDKVTNLHRSLTGLKPVSMGQIEAAQERIESLVADHDKIFDKATDLYRRELLVAGSLPDGDSIQRIEFRNRYADEMDKLMQALTYGTPATATDIAMWTDRIKEEKASEGEFGFGDGSSGMADFTGPSRSPAGVLTEAGVKPDPRVRAHLWAAQKIYLYAQHFQGARGTIVPSLDFWSAIKDGDAPDIWDVWHAQYGLWIQQDVVRAIAAVNKEAAEELRKQGEHAWVGNVPVKELITIRVSGGFVLRDGDDVFGAKAGGYEEALPPGTPTTVFTGNASEPLYDVLQFTVKMVMDQREIPRLIEALTKESTHTLLRVSYEAVPPNRDMRGKIYGSGPAVNVVMDFETILLGAVLRRLMPPSVVDFYGITCWQRDACASAEDDG